MTIAGVTNSSTASTDTTKAAEKTAIDKDAFLKLLVAQLSNQDPLQPTEGAEFVAQLSQFSMVEQSIAQSSKLDAIATQLTGLSSNAAVGLVGQEVTVRDRSSAEAKDVGGKVTRVGFDKGYPEVQLDSGFRAPISDLVTVGGVDR